MLGELRDGGGTHGAAEQAGSRGRREERAGGRRTCTSVAAIGAAVPLAGSVSRPRRAAPSPPAPAPPRSTSCRSRPCVTSGAPNRATWTASSPGATASAVAYRSTLGIANHETRAAPCVGGGASNRSWCTCVPRPSPLVAALTSSEPSARSATPTPATTGSAKRSPSSPPCTDAPGSVAVSHSSSTRPCARQHTWWPSAALKTPPPPAWSACGARNSWRRSRRRGPRSRAQIRSRAARTSPRERARDVVGADRSTSRRREQRAAAEPVGERRFLQGEVGGERKSCLVLDLYPLALGLPAPLPTRARRASRRRRAPAAGEPLSSSPESASALARIRSPLRMKALKSAKVAARARLALVRHVLDQRVHLVFLEGQPLGVERVAHRVDGDAAVVAALEQHERLRQPVLLAVAHASTKCSHHARRSRSETAAAAPSPRCAALALR